MLGFKNQPRAPADPPPLAAAAELIAPAAVDPRPRLPNEPHRGERERHWTVLAISTLILIMACGLRVVGPDRVAVSALPGLVLPPTCVSWNLFGIRCPGCGLTRSFVYLAHGDWRAAWQMHRLGWLLAALVAAQIPYRIAALCRPGRPPLGRLVPKFIGYLVIGLLLVNWLGEVLRKRSFSARLLSVFKVQRRAGLKAILKDCSMFFRILEAPPGYAAHERYLVASYRTRDMKSRVSHLRNAHGTIFAATLEEARKMIPQGARRLPSEVCHQFLELWER